MSIFSIKSQFFYDFENFFQFLFSHFIPELSKMFTDCAMGSAKFCPNEKRVERSLRPSVKPRAYAW